MGRIKLEIKEELLRKLYIEKNLSPQKIGALCGCTSSTIRNRLKEFGIPFKDPAFARQRSPRMDFNGNKELKAYMIGFRIGDLNVYQPSKKSQTIVVRCHTTQYDQVRIMKGLFTQFGKVTASLNNGHYHVNCFVNNSFSFLMPKNDSAWEWIKTSADSIALSFIAGYVDAEGNFILNQGKARFKLDSYDDGILEWISTWLSSKGIDNSFRIIYQMGDRWNGAFPLNKNLWRLNVNDMRSIKKFIDLMLPNIKHKKRMRDMVICQDNVKRRLLSKKTQ